MRQALWPTMVAAATLGLALAACSSSTPPPYVPPSATPTPAITLPANVAPQPFNVGVAVPGTADPKNAAFLADQANLYDPSQFNDPNFYPQGWHWKIDGGIGPHGVQSCRPVTDPQSGQAAVAIDFTPAAAAHWSADTHAAFQQPQGSPGNRIAMFVGKRVASAPQVQSPSDTSTEVSGNFTAATAAAMCASILAAAQR